ncbi:hypothetical protein E8E12_007377 [Didymella heteroderae]|uniref:RRM domain-containing protein n=1 Tax=Didymella heteroderae TaxID=1769908 RepID=A0A9P5C076_9PLEO|nr:hypothetical protein E8E12_007377 [Didymella heteroderae]
MQHKYNLKHMLFVKNVPQDSAMRIAGLFTKYEPLETKNLYPDSRVTTFMIALPGISETEEALSEIDGMRINNIVISVEQYNPKQSIVARRDARKKRNNLSNGCANHIYDKNEYDGFGEEAKGKGDEEVRIKQGITKLTKVTAKKSEPEVLPTPQTRRVNESGGISWANLVGGTQAEKPSPSRALAPMTAKAGNPQEESGPAEPFRNSDHDSLPEDTLCQTEVRATDARPTPLPLRHAHPQIAVTRATVSTDPDPIVSYPPSADETLYAHFFPAPERRIPPRVSQTHSSGNTHVDGDSTKHVRALDVVRMQRGLCVLPEKGPDPFT